MRDELTGRVRNAHGDAWQVEGRLRKPFGGGEVEFPGVRLMASGLPYAWGNSGDVLVPEEVDLDAVRRWYSERSVPWGLSVPAGAPWRHGRRLFVKRCMGLERGGFAPAAAPPGVSLRLAGPHDVDVLASIDAAAFEGDLDASRAWVSPQLASAAHRVALATLHGEPVSFAVSVRSDGRAGACVGLFGVGVVPRARRRGIAAALASWLASRGFAAGAELVHLNPNTDAAARIYARLGFAETGGFDVYVDV